MIAAPAVDVQAGRCVQLVGGRPDAVRVSLPDPVEVAEYWTDEGFGTLHLVDLDAAMESGDNVELLERVIAASGATFQVGGGVRDDARAERLLDAGAARVIVGTRALDDPGWLAGLAERQPGRVMVALDTRAGRLLRRGWTEEAEVELDAYLATLADLPLAGVLSTDVAREGRVQGIDRVTVEAAVSRAAHPVWIAGGVSDVGDLEYLDAAGAAGAVVGTALYTGALDASAVAERWG